jgi:anhydro-N-acetylmuramic acid kinase
MTDRKRALGLMSGTSMDGIDIALIETDGVGHVSRIASASTTYSSEFRKQLVEAVQLALALTDRTQRPGRMAQIERLLTEQHVAVVQRFMGQHSLQPSAIDVIGFHGQTVLHRPHQRLTVQIGDGHLLAQKTGIDVVYDLRAADCAAGGQGAPLVPVYHRALAAKLPQRPLAILNIGGVSNVTYIGRDGALLAFDTGPGSALLDDWMQRQTSQAMDEDGATAATGAASEEVIRFYLSQSFFGSAPPKSLDRNAFPIDLVDHLSVADGAATLTAFTAAAIARSREHMPQEPQLWVVCGGGRRNRTLMSMIAARVENAVVPAEAVGFDGDAMEAEAWAYLAVRSLSGLPITFPGTTGVDQPMTGGVLAEARQVKS